MFYFCIKITNGFIENVNNNHIPKEGVRDMSTNGIVRRDMAV